MDEATIKAINNYMTTAERMSNSELDHAIAEAKGYSLREDGKHESPATGNVYSISRWSTDTDTALELLREMNEQSVTDSLSTTVSWYLTYLPRKAKWCAACEQQSYTNNWWITAETQARAIAEAWYVLWQLKNTSGGRKQQPIKP